MLPHRHNSPARILCSVALCLGLWSTSAFGAPLPPAATSATQSMAVEVAQPTPAITPEDRMRVSVAVSVAAPAEYLEVRLRLRSPSGRLVYQKTEVRATLPAGRHVVEYDYDLSTLDLEPGRYPIDVRVLATDAEATVASSRLLVLDPDAPVLPVAVVVRAAGLPVVTMDGRFARDPDDDSRLREDLAFVTRLARDRREPLALALPPVLIEQCARAAAGFETTAGVVVSAGSESAANSAEMLQGLRSAVTTGTVGLVDVPYALPDLPGLSEIGGDSDLDLHWTRTDDVLAAVLGSEERSAIAYVGPTLTGPAVASLAARGASCVLAPASSLRSADETATPGCYTVGSNGLRVLVVDERAAEGARSGADDFYDALFDRVGSGPVVVMLEIGSGDAGSAVAVRNALEWIDEAPWLRAADIESLSRGGKPASATLVRETDSDAPPGYWSGVAAARASALAYASATGAGDADADMSLRALLAAESSLWAGADGSWSGAAGGLALARQAVDFVTGQFALVILDSKDVTLSGHTGDVPLTLINDTGKRLRLTLQVASSTMRSAGPTRDVDVQPTQNFLTIPVDLGNALSDDLTISVRAGEVTIAEAEVGVRASYIDRLATIAMVVIVLAALLVFIRRRVGRAVAGTIQDDPIHPDRATSGK